jgi:hypothetical protein
MKDKRQKKIAIDRENEKIWINSLSDGATMETRLSDTVSEFCFKCAFFSLFSRNLACAIATDKR